MRLTQEKILQLVYQTMEEINQKIGTDFSKDKIEIAFFTPTTGVSVYEKLCERYFPKHLTQEYKQKGYFETFAAMAFIGEEKDGILIREDVDLSAFEWHHMILHEFSHIIVCREELNGEMFYDKYCVDYADNTIEDGGINAGYAIWREFSAEVFALDLDDAIYPYSLNDAKRRIDELVPFISVENPNAKEAMQKLLNIIFKSDDYYLSKNADEFISRIKKSKVSIILIFEVMIRLVFEQLSHKCAWKIDIDFIREFGCQYLLCLGLIALKNRTHQ